MFQRFFVLSLQNSQRNSKQKRSLKMSTRVNDLEQQNYLKYLKKSTLPLDFPLLAFLGMIRQLNFFFNIKITWELCNFLLWWKLKKITKIWENLTKTTNFVSSPKFFAFLQHFFTFWTIFEIFHDFFTIHSQDNHVRIKQQTLF